MAVLVLASASARRRELLSAAGVQFEVQSADVPEVPGRGESAESFARRVAGEKVAAVAAHCPHRWILGADTVVVLDGAILGKPTDSADARRMLARLSGRAHGVCTAVCLRAPGGDVVLDDVATTLVEFRTLDPAEIDAYVATGEVDDKAGAYAIQGGARGFVVRVEGSHSNVVGLPMELVLPALRRAGLVSERHPAPVS